jgi:hypothetical protein
MGVSNCATISSGKPARAAVGMANCSARSGFVSIRRFMARRRSFANATPVGTEEGFFVSRESASQASKSATATDASTASPAATEVCPFGRDAGPASAGVVGTARDISQARPSRSKGTPMLKKRDRFIRMGAFGPGLPCPKLLILSWSMRGEADGARG